MRIKKFVGHTLKDATEQMKRELGPEAIVVSSRKIIRGGPLNLFGREAFEVTAAIDDVIPGQQNSYRSRPAPQEFRQQLGRTAQELEEQETLANLRKIAAQYERGGRDEQRPLRRSPDAGELVELRSDMEDVKGTLTAIVEHLKYSRMPLLPDTLQKAFSRLVQHDVEEQLAADVVQTVLARANHDQMANKQYLERQVVAALAGLIPEPGPERVRKKKLRVIALVGPTGVGKTTTIAKLAAIHKLVNGQDVGLISADTYRIGAIEQLRTFAGIADIPMEVVYKPSEVPAALRRFRTKDIVFVDTVGRSQRSRKELADLAKFVTAADPDETHLVVNASTNLKTAEDIIDQFKVVKPNRLLFSKLDEAVTYGPLLSLVHRHHLPLSYVTTGQAVPDDIRTVDAAQFAAMVYAGDMAHA
jgi:flagellar biosynthesis protein FlhF